MVLIRDALNERIVILARGIVTSTRLGFSRNRFGEVIERARIGPGAEQFEGCIRPRAAYLNPFGDPALG